MIMTEIENDNCKYCERCENVTPYKIENLSREDVMQLENSVFCGIKRVKVARLETCKICGLSGTRIDI